jgi:hypothetical protein
MIYPLEFPEHQKTTNIKRENGNGKDGKNVKQKLSLCGNTEQMSGNWSVDNWNCQRQAP